MINRDDYYSRKELKELGFNAKDVVRWIGEPDAKEKTTFLYKKSAVMKF